MNNKLPLLLLIVSLAGCDKLTNKVENFDLFGLDQASEAIQVQNDKIKAVREYQKTHTTPTQDIPSDPNPNILGNY